MEEAVASTAPPASMLPRILITAFPILTLMIFAPSTKGTRLFFWLLTAFITTEPPAFMLLPFSRMIFAFVTISITEASISSPREILSEILPGSGLSVLTSVSSSPASIITFTASILSFTVMTCPFSRTFISAAWIFWIIRFLLLTIREYINPFPLTISETASSFSGLYTKSLKLIFPAS